MKVERYRPVSWLRRTFSAEFIADLIFFFAVIAFGLGVHYFALHSLGGG